MWVEPCIRQVYLIKWPVLTTSVIEVSEAGGSVVSVINVFSQEMLCVWWQSALCCGSASLGPELGFAEAQKVDLWPLALQINSPLLPIDKKDS